jgi:hypothetical protein
MNMMKKFSLIALLAAGTISGVHAQEINKDLKHFTRIVASPRVNVILKKGEHENIRLVYHGVDEGKINIDVVRGTLHLYLDNARKVEKMSPYYEVYGSRKSMYHGASITAYVTYTELEALEIRGKQELTCNDPIEAEEFRLKAFGENEITLASLKTDFFKASLFGQNQLKIKNGKVVEQRYKLFGENRIDTQPMKSAFASTSIFGEGNLRITSTEEVRVNAFGEPSIHVNGGARVNKRLIFGRTDIARSY